MGNTDDKSNQLINKKFHKIFGNLFQGYKRKMFYKMEEKQSYVYEQAGKNGNI